jgi:hypothetical protein
MRPVPGQHLHIHHLTIFTHFINISASTTRYLMPHLVLWFVTSSYETSKKYNKIKSSYHAKCWKLYTCRWICSQRNYPNATLSLYLQHTSRFYTIMHVQDLYFMLPTFWYCRHQCMHITVTTFELFLLHMGFNHCTLANKCHWQPHFFTVHCRKH